MRIAYLVNRYPAVSHTFIRREILALERAGVSVVRLALRGWDEAQRGETDLLELARTRYVLRAGAISLLCSFLALLSHRPRAILKALRLVWLVGRRADRPLSIHLVYLIEACQILRWLEAEGVTHVHAHFGTNAAEVAMLVRELGGPPFSFTVHGPEEFDKPALIALSEKIRRSSSVVAVSSFGRSQLMRQVPREHWPKIHVVHCGLETEFHSIAVAPPSSAPPRLVCVGRLCEQKGQLLLIEAAHRLCKEGRHFELVLAGDGEMRAELEALIDTCGLKQKVRITGWISSEEVRGEILASRALVLPSFAEGLPVVIMEAMALCRPVISTYVAGIPELIQPGEHGWLVPAGDVAALAEAMRASLDAEPDRISEMGAMARRRVLARHDIDTEVAKLIHMFGSASDQMFANPGEPGISRLSTADPVRSLS
jgi:colanic acid/amylovoran biosynthesis glycosyltransferase